MDGRTEYEQRPSNSRLKPIIPLLRQDHSFAEPDRITPRVDSTRIGNALEAEKTLYIVDHPAVVDG